MKSTLLGAVVMMNRLHNKTSSSHRAMYRSDRTRRWGRATAQGYGLSGTSLGTSPITTNTVLDHHHGRGISQMINRRSARTQTDSAKMRAIASLPRPNAKILRQCKRVPGDDAGAAGLVLSARSSPALALSVDLARAHEARSCESRLGNLCAPVIITGGTRQILESHQTDSVRVNELC